MAQSQTVKLLKWLILSASNRKVVGEGTCLCERIELTSTLWP